VAAGLVVGINLVVATPGAPVTSGNSGASGAGDCVARHFGGGGWVWYTAGCSGHDEPELDPVSSLPGSAQNLTWTAVLPSDGTVPVSAVGPAFWWGGVVTDPNPHALAQAFLEVQFYPDSVVTNCSSTGGYDLRQSANTFTACTPVWQVNAKNGAETAAFNAMLTDAATGGPLVMHGGDTVTLHFFVASSSDGWHVTIDDLTTGHSGTVVLDSKYGPLHPAFSTQQIGNALGWGLTDDAPNAFVWEIGHTSPFTRPASQLCYPGQSICDSYDISHWLGFNPLRILGVTFADGSSPSQWAVASDFGGKTEVNQYCTNYGTAFCSYPWYTDNSGFITYGGDYPGTKLDYGQASQFAPTTQCGGPFGPDSTYCMTVLEPNP
jgi:hypothetical protein